MEHIHISCLLYTTQLHCNILQVVLLISIQLLRALQWHQSLALFAAALARSAGQLPFRAPHEPVADAPRIAGAH